MTAQDGKNLELLIIIIYTVYILGKLTKIFVYISIELYDDDDDDHHHQLYQV